MDKRKLIQMYKRMFFTFLILVPLFLFMDYYIGASLSNLTKIFIYVLISGLTIALVEFIRYNKKNNKKDK